MSYGWDIGANPERQIWQQLRHAIELPPVGQRTTQTLRLFFGKNALGYTFAGHTQFRPGPALNLSSGVDKVTLSARRVPQKPSIIEREGASGHSDFSDFWSRLFLLFDKTGTVASSPDDADGQVTWTLDADTLDAAGRFLLEPRVEMTDGSEYVPSLLKLSLIPSLVT